MSSKLLHLVYLNQGISSLLRHSLEFQSFHEARTLSWPLPAPQGRSLLLRVGGAARVPSCAPPAPPSTGLCSGSPQTRTHKGVRLGFRPVEEESSPGAAEFGHPFSQQGADPAPRCRASLRSSETRVPDKSRAGSVLNESGWAGRMPSLFSPSLTDSPMPHGTCGRQTLVKQTFLLGQLLPETRGRKKRLRLNSRAVGCVRVSVPR